MAVNRNHLEKQMYEAIDNWQGKKVVLLGDMIADEYLYGEINRISREAPVFIIEYDHHDYCPGGAGNTALQIKALGGEPIPIGVIGDDEEGEILLDYFNKRKIITDFIIKSSLPTIKKTRVIAGSAHSVRQQILRIDKGIKNSNNTEIQNDLLERLNSLLPGAHSVAISDYGYGFADATFIQKILDMSKKMDKITVADSRYQILDFKGVYAATPNEPEVEAALRLYVNEDNAKLETAGFTILSLLNCNLLLITRGKKGMALFEPDKKMELIDIFGTDQIVDVTGAGDTVLGTFALSLSANASPLISAKLANYAGGVVVMKRGTAQASLAELKFSIKKDFEEWELSSK